MRSEADASRLWVGQNITTPGENEFHCGYTGEVGGEASASNYVHKLTDSIARFGTPVQCDYDLTVDGTVTCSALYGGAATQIDNAIAAAVPLWDAGKLTGQSTGTQTANYITNQSRNLTKHPVSFATAFTSPPLVFASMEGNNAGHASIDRIWVEDGVTTTGCTIIVAERSGSGAVTLTWYALQPP